MADQLFPISVKPRSSRSGVTTGRDGGLVIRVHTPAAEGAANHECTRVLAEALGVPRSAVEIVRGAKSRRKQVRVAGLGSSEALARLLKVASGEARAS